MSLQEIWGDLKKQRKGLDQGSDILAGRTGPFAAGIADSQEQSASTQAVLPGADEGEEKG